MKLRLLTLLFRATMALCRATRALDRLAGELHLDAALLREPGKLRQIAERDRVGGGRGGEFGGGGGGGEIHGGAGRGDGTRSRRQTAGDYHLGR